MTDEEIIEMAKQSGCYIRNGHIYNQYVGSLDQMLKTFSKLVAEKEREACIKIVMQGTGEPIQRKTLDILCQERTRIALAIKGQE